MVILDTIIVKDLGNFDFIELYPLADLHIGDPTCNMELFRKWKKHILDAPNRYVVLNGDLCNVALKNSKSDIYSDTMTPESQIEFLRNELYPIRDRILAATTGNHENRVKRETGIDVVKYLFTYLDIADRYKPSGAFLKVRFGKNEKGKEQAYVIYLSHVTSSSLPTVERFCGNLDGVDCFVFSHTHKPLARPISKVVVDPRNNKVTQKDCYILITASFTTWFKSYGQAKSFQPQSNASGYFRLSGRTREIKVII